MKPVLCTDRSGLVAILSLAGTGFCSVCLRPLCRCVCQNVLRVRHKLGSEPNLLVMEPQRLRASTPQGLNLKLRPRFKTEVGWHDTGS